MPRILIVEDEPDIALGLEEDLSRHGYEVEVVRDGETAVRRGCDETWDVILLDVMLPYRDGYDVCRQLRKARVMTPIIMLTAKTHDEVGPPARESCARR
jgi:DNA-binding response OmpR family regulator